MPSISGTERLTLDRIQYLEKGLAENTFRRLSIFLPATFGTILPAETPLDPIVLQGEILRLHQVVAACHITRCGGIPPPELRPGKSSFADIREGHHGGCIAGHITEWLEALKVQGIDASPFICRIVPLLATTVARNQRDTVFGCNVIGLCTIAQVVAGYTKWLTYPKFTDVRDFTSDNCDLERFTALRNAIDLEVPWKDALAAGSKHIYLDPITKTCKASFKVNDFKPGPGTILGIPSPFHLVGAARRKAFDFEQLAKARPELVQSISVATLNTNQNSKRSRSKRRDYWTRPRDHFLPDLYYQSILNNPKAYGFTLAKSDEKRKRGGGGGGGNGGSKQALKKQQQQKQRRSRMK